MNKAPAERGVGFQPHISRIELHNLPAISLPAGALVFVVGPNNGGKSTFLNEILAKVSGGTHTKWIDKVDWELGSNEDFIAYVYRHFRDDTKEVYLKDRHTGGQVLRSQILSFFDKKTTTHPSFLIRLLNAQSRIGLADRTQAPNVIEKTELHPYHRFFYDTGAESAFSKKMKAAFKSDLRVNRTGIEVVGHLGRAPGGDRLSVEYEEAILKSMIPVSDLGDGIRSYTGILLNASADTRPVTIIDEPEAFLHPPQARRLGNEIASACKSGTQQVFIATHSSDFIQGALASKNPNTFFVYLDHSNKERPLFSVDRDTVEEFSTQPFLSHTNALDALFYDQAIVCEGESDIMFFKWALEGTSIGRKLDESFWISAYGKAAIPGILEQMMRLGVRARCVFDLDALLSPEILRKICELFQIDFARFEQRLKTLASSIKVPPAAEALQEIERVVGQLSSTDDDEASRLAAIRAIKKSAEGLGKSWALKNAGMAAIPKGQLYSSIVELIVVLSEAGVILLEEGEIENYVPDVGGHGQAWVRSALEAGILSQARRESIERQFKALA